MNIEEIKTDGVLLDTGESFYGDENFDIDELDREGFEGLDDISVDTGESDIF